MRNALIIGASLLLAGTASADTLDVCLEGCTYSSIQSAIDAAADGVGVGFGSAIAVAEMVVLLLLALQAMHAVGPRTHKIVIEEFCQIGRLEIKFGRLEII